MTRSEMKEILAGLREGKIPDSFGIGRADIFS